MNRPGLTKLSYRVGDFTSFRRQLFDSINEAPELSAWTYRGSDDPGIALLEGQAMAADVLTAYQEIFANESFIATAQWEQSVAGLCRLLGVRAAPGRGGQTAFAFEIRPGADIVLHPRFPMSSELEGRDAPVEWESTAEVVLKPSFSRLQMAWPKDHVFPTDKTKLTVNLSCALTDLPGSPPGTRLFISSKWDASALNGAGDVTSITGLRKNASRWIFDGVKITTFKDSADPRQSVFLGPPHSGTNDVETSLAAGYGSFENAFVFAGIDAAIVPGDWVLLEASANTSYRLCRVENLTVLTKVSGNQTFFYTLLLFDRNIVTAPGRAFALSGYKIWKLQSPWFALTGEEPDFVAEAKNSRSVNILRFSGSEAERQALDGRRVAFVKEGASPEVVTCKKQNALGLFQLQPALSDAFTFDDFNPATSRVTVFGNVLDVTQGKTEVDIIIGSGDTGIAHQTFPLPKSPLTYFDEPQLEVRVQGRPWTRIESFLTATAQSEVYIVREDLAGISWLQFGDGVNGLRLPTGPDNVTATYRVGLGARGPLRRDTVPRAGEKIDRLDKIHQLGEAFGGQDPESPLALRRTAPQKVRALGRLVSLDDYECEVRKIPGVLQVQASWGGIFGEGQNIDFLVFANSQDPSVLDFIREQMSKLDREAGLQRLNINIAFGQRVDAYLQAQIFFDRKVITQADLENQLRLALGLWHQATPPQSQGLFSMAFRTFGQNEYRTRIEAILQNVPGVQKVNILKFGTYKIGATLPPSFDPKTNLDKNEVAMRTELTPTQWLALRDDQTLFVWSEV